MKQTGQPLVDAGKAVAALLSHSQSLVEVDSRILASALVELDARINPDKSNLGALNRLSVLAAYWQNNPLMGKNMGKLPEYQGKLRSLREENPATKKGHCQICGQSGVFSDANRSWFPLAAGADGDPCSLPNLRGKFLCADCFRAVLLLPLGCKFCKAGPYLFHLTEPDLQVEAMKEGVDAVRALMTAHESGNAKLKAQTRLSGRLELLEIVSGSGLWDRNQGGRLTHRPASGATIISFSNSGTSAAWNQLHLPAQALDFFAALTESQRKNIFLQWAEKWVDLSKTTKARVEAICDDIESRRSLAPILSALVKSRKEQDQKLLREEKDVLQIYETVALNKKERFDTLEHIATKVKAMEKRYRDSFVKQLANLRSIKDLMQLITKFSPVDDPKIRLSKIEARVLAESPPAEAINLLYLLCVAED